jgi:hypothetical protein
MSDASVLIIILQVETKPPDSNIENLKWVFSDPYFITQVYKVDPPPDIPANSTLSYDSYVENYSMRKALVFAQEGWPKLPVIIVKDSSICNITPSGTTNVNFPTIPSNKVIGGMKNRIQVALDKASQADLYYLCKWNDVCNQYTDVVGATGSIDHGSYIRWSVQPTATQAIMYTPSSRDFVANALVTATVALGTLLNNYIAQGKLLATAFVPNIIDFDITLATSASDYAKLNECAPVAVTATSSNASSFIWFAIILLLIIIVAWSLLQLGPQYPITKGKDESY